MSESEVRYVQNSYITLSTDIEKRGTELTSRCHVMKKRPPAEMCWLK